MDVGSIGRHVSIFAAAVLSEVLLVLTFKVYLDPSSSKVKG